MISDEKKQLRVLVDAFDFTKAKGNVELMLKFRKELNKMLRAGQRLNPSQEMTRELGQKFDSVYVYCREPIDHLVPKFSSLLYITGLMVVISSTNENLFDDDLRKKINELHGIHGLATSALLHYQSGDEMGSEVRYHLENYMTPFQDEYIRRYDKILAEQRKDIRRRN